MKKLNRILFSILFASLAVPFASCGDDEEDSNDTKDFGAAQAIADIKSSSKSLEGVVDVYSLAFEDFSNSTNDPIYVRGGTDPDYTYTVATKETVNANCIAKKGFVYAGDMVLWSSEKNHEGTPRGSIWTGFDGSGAIGRISGTMIMELPTSGTIDLKNVKAFVAVKAGEDGKVTAYAKNHSVKTDDGVAALVDSAGKILDAVKFESSSTSNEQKELSAKVSSGDVVLFVASSNGNEGTIRLEGMYSEPTTVTASTFAGKTYIASRLDLTVERTTGEKFGEGWMTRNSANLSYTEGGDTISVYYSVASEDEVDATDESGNSTKVKVINYSNPQVTRNGEAVTDFFEEGDGYESDGGGLSTKLTFGSDGRSITIYTVDDNEVHGKATEYTTETISNIPAIINTDEKTFTLEDGGVELSYENGGKVLYLTVVEEEDDEGKLLVTITLLQQ